jgi:DNA polymerase phi
LLQIICNLASKKQWLRQECGWLFFSSTKYLQSSNADDDFSIAIIESLKANNLIRTPEGVAVWLEVQRCFPDVSLPKKIWKHRDPLYKDEVTALAEVMKDARAKQQPDSEESVATQGAGTWSQQLHFSWDVVLRELYSSADQKVKSLTKRIPFDMFWSIVVDSKDVFTSKLRVELTLAESLLSPRSSPERKHWGFLLLAKVVATAPPILVENVFTANTVHFLVASLKVDERYLHRSASKVLQALQSRANKEPNIVSPVAKRLVLGDSGVFNFDAITKTKTIARLLSAANLASIRNLVPEVGVAMARPNVDESKQADAKRQSFADLLVTVCIHVLALSETAEARLQVAGTALDILVAFAYSNRSESEDSVPPISSRCRAYMRSRIRACLDHGSQDRAVKADLLRYTIRKLEDIHNHMDPENKTIAFDEGTQGTVDKAFKNLRRTSKAVSIT